ncbi:unnamed protein product, partial [Effrenium voratum]
AQGGASAASLQGAVSRGRPMSERDLADAIEILPGRLSWVALHSAPRASVKAHFFTVDHDFIYEPFFADFGPLNLSMVWRFCKTLEAKLADPGLSDKRIVHYCSHDPKKRANAATLMSCFQVVVLRKSADEAYKPFASVYPPFLPFRDATCGICTYSLTVLDCAKGMEKAIQCGWFDWKQFDVESYDFFEKGLAAHRSCLEQLKGSLRTALIQVKKGAGQDGALQHIEKTLQGQTCRFGSQIFGFKQAAVTLLTLLKLLPESPEPRVIMQLVEQLARQDFGILSSFISDCAEALGALRHRPLKLSAFQRTDQRCKERLPGSEQAGLPDKSGLALDLGASSRFLRCGQGLAQLARSCAHFGPEENLHVALLQLLTSTATWAEAEPLLLACLEASRNLRPQALSLALQHELSLALAPVLRAGLRSSNSSLRGAAAELAEFCVARLQAPALCPQLPGLLEVLLDGAEEERLSLLAAVERSLGESLRPLLAAGHLPWKALEGPSCRHLVPLLRWLDLSKAPALARTCAQMDSSSARAQLEVTNVGLEATLEVLLLNRPLAQQLQAQGEKLTLSLMAAPHEGEGTVWLWINWRLRGNVKSYQPGAGYGFIQCDDVGDVFLHKSQLRRLNLETLPTGAEVVFDVEMTKRGPQAYNLFLAEEAAKGLPETQAKVAEENCERRFCEYGLNRYEHCLRRLLDSLETSGFGERSLAALKEVESALQCANCCADERFGSKVLLLVAEAGQRWADRKHPCHSALLASLRGRLSAPPPQPVKLSINKLRFTQADHSKSFLHGEHAGQRIDWLVDQLLSGNISVEDPSMVLHVVYYHGMHRSLNNRHLTALVRFGELMASRDLPVPKCLVRVWPLVRGLQLDDGSQQDVVRKFLRASNSQSDGTTILRKSRHGTFATEVDQRTRIHVFDLDYSVTEKELGEHLQGNGVEGHFSVEINYRPNNRSNGYGRLTFQRMPFKISQVSCAFCNADLGNVQKASAMHGNWAELLGEEVMHFKSASVLLELSDCHDRLLEVRKWRFLADAAGREQKYRLSQLTLVEAQDLLGLRQQNDKRHARVVPNKLAPSRTWRLLLRCLHLFGEVGFLQKLLAGSEGPRRLAVWAALAAKLRGFQSAVPPEEARALGRFLETFPELSKDPELSPLAPRTKWALLALPSCALPRRGRRGAQRPRRSRVPPQPQPSGEVLLPLPCVFCKASQGVTRQGRPQCACGAELLTLEWSLLDAPLLDIWATRQVLKPQELLRIMARLRSQLGRSSETAVCLLEPTDSQPAAKKEDERWALGWAILGLCTCSSADFLKANAEEIRNFFPMEMPRTRHWEATAGNCHSALLQCANLVFQGSAEWRKRLGEAESPAALAQYGRDQVPALLEQASGLAGKVDRRALQRLFGLSMLASSSLEQLPGDVYLRLLGRYKDVQATSLCQLLLKGSVPERVRELLPKMVPPLVLKQSMEGIQDLMMLLDEESIPSFFTPLLPYVLSDIAEEPAIRLTGALTFIMEKVYDCKVTINSLYDANLGKVLVRILWNSSSRSPDAALRHASATLDRIAEVLRGRQDKKRSAPEAPADKKRRKGDKSVIDVNEASRAGVSSEALGLAERGFLHALDILQIVASERQENPKWQ